MIVKSNLKWDDCLLTGNDAIDEDHKKIFELVAKLWSENPPSKIESYEAIAIYISEHFSAEESLMRSAGLTQEEIEAHRLDHYKLQDDVVVLSRVFSTKGNDNSHVVAMVDFIQNHLIRHIKTFDAVLAKACARHNDGMELQKTIY